VQSWATGTERADFAGIASETLFLGVERGGIMRL
jgi:hypothetical protein